MHVQLVCASEFPIKQMWHENKDFLLLIVIFFNCHMDFLKNYFTMQNDWLECVFKSRSWFSFLELFLSKQTGEGVSSANLKRHQLQDFLGSSA